jgi:hypothetical protein
MVLMPQALLLNKWVFGLAELQSNIVTCLQMVYQIVLGGVGHIALINPKNKLGTILCSMYIL